MTSPDRWQQVERLYHEALARQERDRAAFLRDACAGDELLRLEIESLVAYADAAPGFMAAPAIQIAAEFAGADTMTSRLAGMRLGPYEIGPLLGKGGMGEVYRARDTKLERDVAVKILPDAFTADADRRARFEREARLLAALNHPNIGAIYGFEDRDGVHALVLELIEGETLADRLAGPKSRPDAEDGEVPGRPLPIDEALTIAWQVAEALEAAHDRGIVHRDLKPSNVILQGRHSAPPGAGSSPSTADMVIVKVVDFGLAKVDAGASAHGLTESPTISVGRTSDGVILGTAPYMSPEQVRGRVVDKRTDIWAFGCVLYEMLTGRKAFRGETVSDAISAILGRGPDWSALPPAAPPRIHHLLRRCLEKDPKNRLHDIADARIEIVDALRDPIGGAVDTGSPAARPATVPRTVWSLAAAATLLVVLGIGLATWWWPNETAPPPSSPARLTIPLPVDHTLDKGRFQPMALSPDGTLLVYAASVNGGRTSLFVRPLGELDARPIPETEGAAAPFFSPDGRWLAFYADGLLRKVSVAGGVPLTIGEAPPVWSAAWGAGDRIVFASTLPASGLWLVSANGGEPMPITMPSADDAQHAYPQMLPDGRQVLFSVRRNDGWHLALLGLESGDWRLVGSGRVIGEGAQYLPTGHLVYAQSGGLIATPFDPAAATLDQPPVPLLERVETSRFGGTGFAVAPNSGTLVYLPASTTVAERTLLRVERDGRAVPLIEARAGYESPALSQDGRRVAVTIAAENGNDIWIIDLERATRIRFTSGGTSAFPVWGRGDTTVAFQSTGPEPWNLFWKPLDGSSDARPILSVDAGFATRPWRDTGESLLPGTLPTLTGGGAQFPASWSPDGAALAFHERKPSGERDIWVVSPGAEPAPFLLTPFDERSPRFSPDGRWLAYVSDESGRNDVYVQPFPGPGPKWLVSTDGGVDPVWSRDGRGLFYRQGDEIMAVTVVAGPGFSAGRPQRLFEMRMDARDDGPNFDVSRDGTWFVTTRSEQGPARGELHVVLNWFGEVRARSQQ